MDRETLRMALFVIGTIIVIVILILGSTQKRRQKNVKRRLDKNQFEVGENSTAEAIASEDSDNENEEIGMQQELEALKGMGAMIAADKEDENLPPQQVQIEQDNQTPAEPSQTANSSSSTAQEKPVPSVQRPDKVVTLYLQSLGKQRIHGTALLEATVKTGLVYGKMKLFHRVPEGSTQSLFSLANGLKPGTFDPTAWSFFETPMLTLFFSLPAPFEGLPAWESMLATANRLADLLGLAVLDNQQIPLNRERIGEIREELRLYDREHTD